MENIQGQFFKHNFGLGEPIKTTQWKQVKRRVLDCCKSQPIDYKPARLTNCGCKKDTLEVVAPIVFLLLQLLLPIMQHVATVPAKWVCMNLQVLEPVLANNVLWHQVYSSFMALDIFKGSLTSGLTQSFVTGEIPPQSLMPASISAFHSAPSACPDLHRVQEHQSPNFSLSWLTTAKKG
jgi:hypothetical protein